MYLSPLEVFRPHSLVAQMPVHADNYDPVLRQQKVSFADTDTSRMVRGQAHAPVNDS